MQALDSGGAVYATGLLEDGVGSSVVMTGCAFLNNTAANYVCRSCSVSFCFPFFLAIRQSVTTARKLS